MEKRSSGLSRSCILIIVMGSVERFVFKGVASNLVTYLTDVLHMNTSAAAKSISVWNGVTSMLPLFTAVLADSYWDRFSTVIVSSLLYVVGLGTVVTWALMQPWMRRVTLFLPLYLISVAQSAYNPSLQAFATDQLGLEDRECTTEEEKSRLKSLFFQWWYFGICAGSLLGNSMMSYIQDTFSWSLGFAVPCITMAVSMASFVCFARSYVRKQPREPKRTIAQFVKGAARKINATKAVRLPSDDEEVSELELQEKALRVGDGPKQIADAPVDPTENTSVVGLLRRLLPVWTMLLMFAVIFQLPPTFFTKQGMLMNHRLWNGFTVPPAMLQSAITISIVLLMPLYDKMIIPLIRAVTGNDKGINIMQRISIGMCLSVVAMITAAAVESWRMSMLRRHSELMSIFFLLPQYVLLGVSDVFTVVGMQEFFYTHVPGSMRTIGFGLYLSVFGFGSFIGAMLISVLEAVTATAGDRHGWFSDDPAAARLDNYYWFLAFLSSISFLTFNAVSRSYK